ncbi:hypothetical protein DPEC_G00197270 [Dallia pectoralis]|uniref:Uncharacterized protein n=1 Tax=Dallia pectoralis TaxID=75939 RepID=A0ACC2G7K1_DALPE|nr:hypothetical protein DPEC_G00197270 [Dallia pectoralis]
MEAIDLESKDPYDLLSGYANGEIITVEISDVSPDLLILEVKENHLPESIYRNPDMELSANFRDDDDEDDDGHGFANVELQFFPCDACEASFTSEQELEEHLIVSHSVRDVPSERGRLKANGMDFENHARVKHQDQYRTIVKAMGNAKKCIINDTLRSLQTRRDDNQ